MGEDRRGSNGEGEMTRAMGKGMRPREEGEEAEDDWEGNGGAAMGQ